MVSLLVLAFLFVDTVVANSKPAAAVFQTMDTPLDILSGKVYGGEDKLLFAFALQPDSINTRRYYGLLAPNYQTPVENQTFQFSFIARGNWVLGIYEDKNKNGLIDLPMEPVWLHPKSPVSHPQDKEQIQFDLDALPGYFVDVKNVPPNEKLGVLLLSKSMHGLFSLPLPPGGSLILPVMEDVSGFVILEDKQQNGILEAPNPLSVSYLGHFAPKAEVLVEYLVPFRPFSLEMINKPDRLEVCIYRDFGEAPRACSNKDILKLHDLEPGNWLIQFSYPFADDVLIFTLDEVKHVNKTEITHTFNEHIEVKLKNDAPQNWLDIRIRDQILARISPSQVSEFPFLLKDYYDFIFYDTENAWSDARFARTAVQSIRLDLREDYSSWDLKLPNNPKSSILGVVHTHSSFRTGKVVLFQNTSFPNIENVLGSFALSSATTDGAVPFQIDWQRPEPVMVCPDFDENSDLSLIEREFCTTFEPQKTPRINAYLELSPVNRGQLEITTPNEGTYYIQILNPPKEELLKADFLYSNSLTFYDLPVGRKLKIAILHDTNENGMLDGEDRQLPPLSVEIPVPLTTGNWAEARATLSF